MTKQSEEKIGGTGSVSAGSKAHYRPESGAAVGTEGGADPAGQAPKKGRAEAEQAVRPGPHAGSGA